jgi:sugar phosphate isomerase/epimerase
LNIGVEIQDFVEPSLLDKGWEDVVSQYKMMFEKFNGACSVHGPFLDLKPISPDKTIREASYNRYLVALNIAKELKAQYIVFHSQINPFLNEPYIRKLNHDLNKKFFRDILREIGNFKGTIVIENIFEGDPSWLRELIDIIDLSNVKICLDIGHAKLMSGEDQLKNWFKILKDDIKYIHFHWNNGIYDEHKPPMEENIRLLSDLLEKFDLNPVISLEYKVNSLAEEIKRIRKNI